jgi:hypothetical protein
MWLIVEWLAYGLAVVLAMVQIVSWRAGIDPSANRDEPDPPPWFPDKHPIWPRRLLYLGCYMRNPLHNFTHYVVGIAGKPFTVAGSRADSDNDGFADQGGWLHCTLHCNGGRPPYVSYSGWCHFYAGGHPSSGKLGLRLTRSLRTSPH